MHESFTYRGESWTAETSGYAGATDGIPSVGVWFTNDATGEQIHGDLNLAVAESPSDERLVDALDVTLCKHAGLTRAVDAAGILDHDIIATLRPDGQFDVRQRIQGSEHFLEGPMAAADAERRAIDLASEEQGDAWIQESANTFRLLT